MKKEKKTNKKNVAEEYGVKKSRISTWIASRTKIIEVYESGQANPNPKKLKKSDLDEAFFYLVQESALKQHPFQWICYQRENLDSC